MTKLQTTIQEIDAYIEKSLRAWKVPGAAVAIIKDNEVILSKRYGVKEVGKDEPVDENTIFQIASCTKNMTAAALGMLVDEGKVGWDDKIIQHLPDFRLPDPWMTQEVTIRDMLTHQLGFEETSRLLTTCNEFDPDDLITRMRFMKSISPFRRKCLYLNAGYNVVGKIIEVVSGQSWDKFMQERIFDPLEMKATSATMMAHQKRGFTNVATGHATTEFDMVSTWVRMFEDVQPAPFMEIGKNAAGSVLSNVTDSIIWLKMLLNNGIYEGKQLLSPEVVKELTSAQVVIKPEEDPIAGELFSMGIDVDILAYGLGWYLGTSRKRHLLYHGGNYQGFVSGMMLLPHDNIGTVLLLNTTQTIVHPFLAVYIADALLGLDPPDYCGNAKNIMQGAEKQARAGAAQIEAARAKDSTPTLPLAEYAGRYTSKLYDEIQITFQDGQLTSRHGESGFFDAKLEHWEHNNFLARYQSPKNRSYDPEIFAFELGQDGKILTLEISHPLLGGDRFKRI